MSTTTIAVLIAFVCYLAMMIGIGIFSMKKTNSTEDYFLGGRGLNSWVAALSAQASDMSGWLLMGLPGSIYLAGTGKAWIAIGLFIGTALNWICISKRLRRYTIVANNSLTLPEFFQNRFRDKKKILLGISSVVIVIFFLVYTASALASGGKLFQTVFGLDYHYALLIGAAVILAYTFMGGFLAVCTTDFVQGTMMLIALLTVPIIAYAAISGDFTGALTAHGVAENSDFLSLFYMDGKPYPLISIVSDLAWGLGYCGMPHILVRFMAVKSEKELKKSSVIAIVWVAISLIAVIVVMVFFRIAPTVNLLALPLLLIYMLLFCSGLGMLLSALAVFFRDVCHLWGVVITAWTWRSSRLQSASWCSSALRRSSSSTFRRSLCQKTSTHLRSATLSSRIPSWTRVRLWSMSAMCPWCSTWPTSS